MGKRIPAGELIAGWHAVTAALENNRAGRLWLREGRGERRYAALLELAKGQDVTVQYLNAAELDKLLPDTRHQGVVAQLTAAAPVLAVDLDELLDALEAPPFLLLLDGVQDPHNLGACMRTAEAAGVHAVVIPRDRAVGLTPAARKAAAGAAERLPLIQVTNLARCIDDLKQRGIWLTGLTAAGGSSLYALDLRGPLALVLGAEGSGLRRLTEQACDFTAQLPMATGVESLNVSVTAGIAMYEAVRQRSMQAPH